MAKKISNTEAINVVDEKQIMALYMNDILEDNHNTKNVYVFCKNNAITEADFYSFFGSLDAVKDAIWVKFFENAVETVEKDENYFSYSDKNKLLALHFTLFEILTLNRSYVAFVIGDSKSNLLTVSFLKKLKNRFKEYVIDLIETTTSENKSAITKITKPLFSEGAWVQFLFILKFWLNDNSKGFEKTDIVIEKSINTVVDLLDTKPLEGLFDLGKFLYKESKAR